MTRDCPVGLAVIRKRMIKRLSAIAVLVLGLVTSAASAIRFYRAPIEIMQPEYNQPEQDTVELLGAVAYTSE